MREKKIYSQGWALAISLLLLVLFAAAPAAAVTWDVSDGNSIQAAIDNASAGDTVRVHAGTYAEALTIDKSLTLEGIDNPVINHATDSSSQQMLSGAVQITGGNSVFRGFTINYTQEYCFGIYITANDVLVENNTLTNCNEGIWINGVLNTTVRKNVIQDCWGWTGLYDGPGSSGNWIYLNDFIGNSGSNTQVYGSSQWYSPEELTYSYGGVQQTGYLGNYYDTYTGTDAGNDGVGDTAAGTDTYPLMAPFANYEIGGSAPAAPVADFTANVTNGTAPIEVQFTDLSAGDPTEWAWDFENDGVVDSTEQNPTHTYTAAGTYSVNLTVTNAAGSDSEVKTDCITVNEGTSPATDFTYTSDGTAITITGYTGPGGDVVIPGTIEGLPVVDIGKNAFKGVTALTSVVIPDSVTSIGEYAFRGCTALTSVTIGNGVTAIGKYAFRECTALTSVTIPDSVTTIGDYAFRDCTALTSMTLPESVTTIGNAPFSGCTALTAVYVDADNNAYASIDGVVYDKDITTLITCPSGKTGSLVIPGSVTTIGERAFYQCTALTSVTIPDSVTTIGDYAFRGCTLTSVIIPDSVTSIGERAFYQNTALTSVTIGNGVTTISGYAFYQCSALTSVIIGNGVTTIGEKAFQDCTALTSVTIGNGVTTIGNKAFCSTGLTSVIIPDSVTTIEGQVFQECPSLSSVTIGNGVTSIGGLAFGYCPSLTSVTIGSSVTTIGNFAFQNCTSLALMTFDGNAPTVGSSWAGECTNLVVYYHEGATGFTTPTWEGVPCYPLATAPTADFSASPTSGDAPLAVQFTDESTNDPTAWAWDFENDGTVDSTEQNPAFTYTAAGTYTVSLTVTNAGGSDDEVKADYITVSVPGPEYVTLSFAPTAAEAGLGETIEVSIVADAFPAGLAGYNLTVTLGDPSVAEITAVNVPDWASLNATGGLSSGSVWIKAADLGESISTDATNVTLATLTLTGLSSGTANITATVTRMDADDGSVIESVVIDGEILVPTGAAFPGCKNCPHDLNGDGICEDINGNGLFDFDDVVTFFNRIEWAAANEPTEILDVNANGRIDFADIVGLYTKL